ncbi:MAG TPA: PSD1 and planctomycete cytochrome C domain-containing protein [Pirellulales bacterium]
MLMRLGRCCFLIWVPAILLVWAAAPAVWSAEIDPARVDFVHDIAPLLKRSCLECHGPKRTEGELRLDLRDKAFAGGASGPVIEPGKPDTSELLRRISRPAGDDEIMPSRGAPLAVAEIELIRTWIRQGAPWPEHVQPAAHWAYVRPTRPPVPKPAEDATIGQRANFAQRGWVRSPIDAFVLARLQRAGLRPSPEADRATLIRRLSLDLVGLPPAPAEVAAFVGDQDPHAYERLVDRLLASEQFGVRWARPWLDAARYADSHGFQRDDLRDIWAYRDWVVEAFNHDMPFDQFTIQQLAGDLLPGATESQKIATGFGRNAPTNVEAGSDPEETRVNQVLDRMNTLGMVWLGTTLECCQCHDHKYDPFSASDYYSLFAFFNNTDLEADRTNPKVPGSIAFRGPTMNLPDPEIQTQRKQLQDDRAALDRRLALRAAELRKSAAAWEHELAGHLGSQPQEQVLEVLDFDSLAGSASEVLPDKSVLVSGETPDRDTYTIEAATTLTGIRAIKLEALTDPSLPGNGPGRGDADRPNFVLQSLAVKAAPNSGGPAKPVKFRRAKADFSQRNFDVAGAIDDAPKTAWAIAPKFHAAHWAVFETAEPLGFAGGTKLTVTLEQNFGAGRTIGRLRLTALVRPDADAVPAAVVKALGTPAKKRTPEQTKALAVYQRDQDATYRDLQADRTQIQAKLAKLQPPTTLVMHELPKPRASAIFVRGDFRNPGTAVEPATPAVLPPMTTPTGQRNRLALARWLVQPDHPLVARVTVNRWWAELFGHGIVTTPEDFGIKGQPPTHPELLDWLAAEYIDNGWSLKKLLRTIVLSATYRQTSTLSPELAARDDQNLLYARGARFRLDAEAIRDSALSIAGLLSPEQGGAPVRPFQPDGLWVKVGGQKVDYVVSPGERQYRRGLYVVLKRAAPYPSFVNFDANARLACRVKRPRSNTPLQALTLLNDPVYVEAALALARRIVVDRPEDGIDARLAYLFRLAVARTPDSAEVAVLRKLWDAQRAAAKDNPAAARELVGKLKLPPGVAADEFAAWYAAATAVLNLDETINRG